MQPAEALLLGFLGVFALVVSAALIWVIHNVGQKVEQAGKQVDDLHALFVELHQSVMAIKESTQLLAPAIRAVMQTAKAMNDTSEAIRGLSNLMTNRPPEEPPAAASAWRGGAPPNPLFDNFAPPDEAGYIEQSDEDLAEIERQETLREQGIETDPLRIPKPSPEQMNYGGSV